VPDSFAHGSSAQRVRFESTHATSKDYLQDLLNHAPVWPTFDADTYRILTRALAKRQVQVRVLPQKMLASNPA
jgi:hypothetical protein